MRLPDVLPVAFHDELALTLFADVADKQRTDPVPPHPRRRLVCARQQAPPRRLATSATALKARLHNLGQRHGLGLTLFALPRERPLKSIAICVPARDEAAELPNLFRALDRLDRRCGVETHVCILLDGCTDGSDELAASFRACSAHRVQVEQSVRSGANAGRARHLAMMMGSRALGTGDGLLLTTDADSMPAPEWLTAMAAGLDHADVVLGKVVRVGDRPNPLQDRVEFYYENLVALRRRLDPLPWEAARIHHHTSGANMGFRADAYRALGGFASVVSGEDALLADDAARAGMRVRRDAGSVVFTSDRREGRAQGGMAIALQQLDGGNPATVTVAHPADAAWQYRLQSMARVAHGDGRPELVAASIGLGEDHVKGVARDCPNAEAFAMRIVPTPPGGMRHVALPVAEAELAKLLDAREAA